MAAQVKPQIQQYFGGYSATGCVLDLDNRFSKNVVELKARAPFGSRLNLDYVFIPYREIGRGPEQRASAEIGEFSPKSLMFTDPNRWEKIVWKPGRFLVPGLVKARAKFIMYGGYFEERVEIQVKGAGPRMLYLNEEARDVPITLKYQSGSTKDYKHVDQGKFAFEGAVGCRVRLKLTWDGREYGHDHDAGSSHPHATGWFNRLYEPYSFIDLQGKGRLIFVDYTSLGVCGNVTVKATFHDNRWQVLRTQTIRLTVSYRPLMRLPDSDYYVKVSNDSDNRDRMHLKHLYGTSKLFAAIEKLSKAFYEEFNKLYLQLKAETGDKNGSDGNATDTELKVPEELAGQFKDYQAKYLESIKPKPGQPAPIPKATGELIKEFLRDYIKAYRPLKLMINDMSLPNGGRFDIEAIDGAPFTPKHKRHMFGENVDISFNGSNGKHLNTKQIKWLLDHNKEFFSGFEDESEYNHIHLNL